MRMDICLSADDNYAKYMGTTIASILSNSKEDEEIYFHLLDGGITEESKNKLLSLKNIKNCNIIFYSVNSMNYKYDAPHFFRLNVPSLIPNIDKLLYLDCDTIVLNSLKELFEIDINNYYALACEDVFLNCIISFKNMHGLSADDIYFNSGVLMINNKLWRDDKLENIFYADYSKFGNTGHADQDVLNRIIKGKVKIIDSKWNFLSHKKVYSKAPDILSVNIIHYAGEKPWKETSSKAFFIDEFWKYYQLTPWCKENTLDAVKIMISQKVNDYEDLKLNVNRIKFFGFYKNKDKVQIVLFFIRITIELNLDTVKKISWWIPIKKLRDKFRSSILD
ncbi:glycosyltransferase family 8 protein [uncultured Brachyspira sp.]|uniref:glycosyltransferase family 8 protein n=1 Tax=uncultured Brachyspira sp. TaxID=221953 RepID=UPI002605A05B|nr:glycosyltransferase family 8 protein [uncultured Brachyspira sp.]